MAIKVSGTEVISDSRALNNIATVDATTAASITAAGVGGGATHEATASGALANGDLVIVNSDGTVSVVEETTISESLGSATVFETGASRYFGVTYDSNSDKIVIAYQDENNSDYGTAVVGTISGTSISFGTPVVFASNTSRDISITFDSSNNKVVIGFYNANNYDNGECVVGTVSGTSISFGSRVSFTSNFSGIRYTTLVFDSSNNKVVVAYRDQNNSFVGTAKVGTVSGTSISFGSSQIFYDSNVDFISATFDSSSNKVFIAYSGGYVVGTVSGTSISFGIDQSDSSIASFTSCAFDPNSNKIVLAYRANISADSGDAKVGTISGTSITFGTAVTFESSQYGESGGTSTMFDAASGKMVIAYTDRGDSSKGKYVTGTVSGDSISFTSPTIYMNNTTEYPHGASDGNGKAVLVAQDFGNSQRGTARVLQIGYDQPNLTSSNYIGVSDGAYSDTATATVQVAGAVDDAQTGLTAGQSYYVQTDGTLSTTPDDPSVFAGTAVSATEIIVKG